MHFEHFVITRFCIRSNNLLSTSGARFFSGVDPLRSAFLEARFKLMEMVSSAALVGQSDDDFSWIILVDPALKQEHRDRLRALCHLGTRLIIHEANATQRLDRTGWLEPYFRRDPDYVITTHLDDDDAFTTNYVSELRHAARLSTAGGNPPILRTFGCKHIWLWNLIYSRRTPLGTRSDWRRGGIMVPACGFSLMSKYPEVPLTVMAMRHKWAEDYLDFTVTSRNEDVVSFRKHLGEILEDLGMSLRDQEDRLAFQDLSELTGPVVMGNHLWNDQVARVLEEQVSPSIVSGQETFPDHSFNWDAVRKHLPGFRLPILQALKVRMRTWRRAIRDLMGSEAT